MELTAGKVVRFLLITAAILGASGALYAWLAKDGSGVPIIGKMIQDYKVKRTRNTQGGPVQLGGTQVSTPPTTEGAPDPNGQTADASTVDDTSSIATAAGVMPPQARMQSRPRSSANQGYQDVGYQSSRPSYQSVQVEIWIGKTLRDERVNGVWTAYLVSPESGSGTLYCVPSYQRNPGTVYLKFPNTGRRLPDAAWYRQIPGMRDCWCSLAGGR